MGRIFQCRVAVGLWSGKKLNTGRSVAEAQGRLETHHPLNNHHPHPLIPVNMLCYLWKGLIAEIILWNNGSVFDKLPTGEKALSKWKTCVCKCWLLHNFPQGENWARGNTQNSHIFKHKCREDVLEKRPQFKGRVVFLLLPAACSPLVNLQTLKVLLLSKSMAWFDSMLIPVYHMDFPL